MYVEKGDIFKVDDLEMFILNCEPEHGFVSCETNVKFKFGLDKENCLEFINRADNEYARNLMNLQERMIVNPNNQGNGLPRLEPEDAGRFIMSDFLNPLSMCKIFSFCIYFFFMIFSLPFFFSNEIKKMIEICYWFLLLLLKGLINIG